MLIKDKSNNLYVKWKENKFKDKTVPGTQVVCLWVTVGIKLLLHLDSLKDI